MKNSQLLLSMLCALGTMGVNLVHAQATMDHSKMGGMAMGKAETKASAATMSEGEVQKLDLKAQTITLKHGPLKNLDMPPMTMAFKVKSGDMMNKVKPGDKVRFLAEMPGGNLTISAIELLK
jgi:Cu(I)/Ag(I) efflux system protein CusF